MGYDKIKGKTAEQDVQQILEEAPAEGQNILIKGKITNYIPEFTRADSSNLGRCIINMDGSMYKAGDYNIPFTMRSIARIFSLVLVLQASGYDHTSSRVGMGPIGDHFGSILQLELEGRRPFDPTINAGMIMTVDCVAAADPFGGFLTLIRRLCGNPKIQLNGKVYHSEKRTGTGNRSIAYLLKGDHVLDGEPEGMLDVYFRICSVMCTAKDLACYAVILSSRGVNPKTGERLLDTNIVHIVTALMMLCGIYDESGEYVAKVGLPSESGVGGGIVTVEQNDIGIDTSEPILDRRGNSVDGERILQYLSEHLGYHIFT